jgi:methyl-accepting chemotaxis protein
MEQGHFAGRFKIGTRIYTGFVIVLVLLVLVSVAGIRGLSGAEQGIIRYADVAGDTQRLQDIQVEVANFRREVVLFIERGDLDAAGMVRKRFTGLDPELKKALEGANTPAEVREIERMIRLFKEYAANFDTLVQMQTRRQELLEGTMNPLGARIRATLTEIMATAFKEGKYDNAARAGMAQEALMLARLNAFRFLASPEAKLVETVRDRVKDFNARVNELLPHLVIAQNIERTKQAIADGRAYEAAFQELAGLVMETNRLAYRVMAEAAKEFNELAESTGKSSVEFMNQTEKMVEQTVTESTRMATILSGLALFIGALFAWIVARSITTPVLAMTEAMAHLAGGNLAAEIPARTNRDEIGEMAKAVQVFKDNAIEKKRMDAAEQERLEAERRSAEAQRQREQEIGREIATLIDSVSRGDLSTRIDLSGKDGFYRTMSEGINRLTDTVQAVISDLASVLESLAGGDLTRRIVKDYQGEFEKLKADVNATSAKLAEIVGEISNATDAISAAATQVSAGSADLAERTEQQASSLEETAASMEELGATVRTSADNARRADGMAGSARNAAEQGGAVATSAIEAMKRIAEASRKITDIIGVIDEIAFQTNLLALNAAVEAARAGDAGKGFAVVAQEVRVLAQRSAQASKEIKVLILDSDAQVQNGVDMVKKAGDSLGGIVGSVQQVAGLIGEIAAGSSEQATALDEINASVAAMDEMTQKNAALVEETTAAAQSMAGQAGDLRQLVGFFRLEQSSHHGAAARHGDHRSAPPPAAARTPTRRTG